MAQGMETPKQSKKLMPKAQEIRERLCSLREMLSDVSRPDTPAPVAEKAPQLTQSPLEDVLDQSLEIVQSIRERLAI